MKNKSLLQSLEEFAESMPVNSTEPMVQPNTDEPNATGEVVPVVAAEDNGSMPENDTSDLIVGNPEDPNPTGEVKEIGDEMVEEGKETESGIQELEVLAQEAEQVLVDLGNVNSAVDELEQYRTTVAQAAAKNDLTGVGAEILSTALESLYARHNIQSFGRAIPSMESFSTPVKRARSATIALEEVDNKFAKIKQFIVDMFKKLINGLKEFMNKAIGHDKNLANKNKQAIAKIQEIKSSGTKLPGGQIEDEDIARLLGVNGQFPSNVLSDIDASVNLQSVFIKGFIYKRAGEIKSAMAIATSDKFSQEWAVDFATKYTTAFNSESKTYVAANYAGNTKLVLDTDTSGGDAVYVLGKLYIHGDTVEVKNSQIKLLNSEGCENATKLISKIEQLSNELKVVVQQANEANSNALNAFNTVNVLDANSGILRGLSWQYTYFARNLQYTVNYLLKIRQGLLKLIEKSINAGSSEAILQGQPQQQ